MARKTRALTLIEGLIFAGLIMLLAVLVIPQVKGARISTNEIEAVKTLKAIWKMGIKSFDKKNVERLKETRPDLKVLSPKEGTDIPILFHHGYLFYMWQSPETKNQAIAYAWPWEIESSGISTFFMDENGKIFFSRNLRERYSGLGIRPDVNAAFPMPTPSEKKQKTGKNGSYLGQDYQWWTPLPTGDQ